MQLQRTCKTAAPVNAALQFSLLEYLRCGRESMVYGWQSLYKDRIQEQHRDNEEKKPE